MAKRKSDYFGLGYIVSLILAIIPSPLGFSAQSQDSPKAKSLRDFSAWCSASTSYGS